MSHDGKATETMRRMLEEFEPVRLEYERLVGAKKGRMVTGGAAPAKAIASKEKALQFQFPPSYHVFLSMHNGWLSFWPDWSVFGVDGSPTDRMERDVKKRIKWYDDAIEHNAAYEDEDPKEALAQAREKDRRSRSAVYMPHHPVVATDFNGGVMVFDRHRRRKDGETPR